MKILMDDDPILRTVSEPVAPDDDIEELLDHMIEAAEGAFGLAAIQLGVPKRVIIIRETKTQSFLALVNPECVRQQDSRLITAREGCLSIPPRKWGQLARPAKCDAKWQDPGSRRELSATFSQMLARAFLHEVDHLDGILMTDRMNQGGTNARATSGA